MAKKEKVAFGLEMSSLALKEATNYYRWIYSGFSDKIGQDILEVGAGIGNFSKLVADRHRIVLLDNSQAAIDSLKELFKDKINVEVLRADIVEKNVLSLLGERNFDTIICFNVLEHIEDQYVALSIMRRLLNKNGHLLLLVPAHNFIFGSIDRLAGHLRRYNKAGLKTVIQNAGFHIERMCYFNSIGAIAWFILYRVFKEKAIVSEATRLHVSVFDRLFVPVISKIENIINPPFGISLLAVCTLPE